MTARSLTLAALAAILVSCGAENPQPSAAASDGEPAGAGAIPTPDTAAQQAPSDPEPGPGLLTAEGWGPLRIGMRRADVVAAAGEDASPDAVAGPDPQSCDQFRPREAPEGVLVMIEDGVLTRITVSRNPGISTPAGIHVGDTAAEVLAAYGARARVQPHKYWAPPARYITVWSQDPPGSAARGIRYEVGPDERVVHLHGGGPAIEYVEGCL